MDLLNVIRRWHGRDNLSVREIARRTGHSCNTIRKYLANATAGPKYPTRQSASSWMRTPCVNLRCPLPPAHFSCVPPADPRRTDGTWIHGLRDYRVALHATPAWRPRSAAAVGGFLAQPQGRHRRDGLFHRAHGVAQNALRVVRDRARSAA